MVRGEKVEKINLLEGFDLKYIVIVVSGDSISERINFSLITFLFCSEDFSWLLDFSLT